MFKNYQHVTLKLCCMRKRIFSLYLNNHLLLLTKRPCYHYLTPFFASFICNIFYTNLIVKANKSYVTFYILFYIFQFYSAKTSLHHVHVLFINALSYLASVTLRIGFKYFRYSNNFLRIYSCYFSGLFQCVLHFTNKIPFSMMTYN